MKGQNGGFGQLRFLRGGSSEKSNFQIHSCLLFHVTWSQCLACVDQAPHSEMNLPFDQYLALAMCSEWTHDNKHPVYWEIFLFN